MTQIIDQMDDNNVSCESAFFHEGNYKKIKHESGLTIILNMMPKYTYSYAVVGVKYGSANNEFKRDSACEDFLLLPQGVAHFLEHKMFENEDGEDTLQKFAHTGAMANAYTGFDQTCYLISCSQHLEKSLHILLNSILNPYFTSENVEKEKGIIAQEIRMCEDDPNWQCYFEVIRGLYYKIPIIYDIAGTEETINLITPEHLYECYNTFYNLNNMVLSVAGNFDYLEVLETVDRVLAQREKSRPLEVINKSYDEPMISVRKRNVLSLPVELSLIKVGFKHIPAKSSKSNFILNIKHCLINDLIVGRTSALYCDLYYNKIISRPISYEVLNGDNYLASIFSVSSQYPELVEKKLFDAIDAMKQQDILESDFLAVKKSFYGRYVSDMDNPEIVATNHMTGYLDGVDFREWQNVIMNIEKAELEELIRNSYNYDSSSVSIVNPMDK